jgi:hypothetical protein
MLHKVAWTSLVLEIGGDRIQLRGLPLAKRRQFVDLQTFLADRIQQFPDLSLGTLYDLDEDFRWGVDESLRLFGLSPESVSAVMVNQLLFAYDGGAGVLWRLEFPDSEQVAGRLLNPEIDPYHAAIAAVWSYSPELPLDRVIESLSEISWLDVQGILEQRNRLTIEANPELQKAERERIQREQLKREVEGMDFNNFFEGFNPFGQQVA